MQWNPDDYLHDVVHWGLRALWGVSVSAVVLFVEALTVVVLVLALTVGRDLHYGIRVAVRYAKLYAAWLTGVTRRWVSSGWRPYTIGAAVFCLIWASLWVVKGKAHGITGILTWNFVFQAFGIYGLLLLVFRSYLGSRQVEIVDAVTHAEGMEAFTAGLAARLNNELRRLGRLYITIDEADPINSVSKVTEARATEVKVTVRDRDKVLRGVVDEKSAVKLGPMAVPLKPLFDALARLSPKRYLSSSLHRSGKSLILLATLSHGGGNWRIERVIPDQPTEQDKADKLNEMFDELVYRVFAAIVPTGSRDWRAVQRYMEGLRSYGETLTSDMECDRKLWEAANKFLAARGIDKTFARCSYNLGVVYIGLEKWDAAQAMFERALAEDSKSADAAYALALHHQLKAEPTAKRLEMVRALEYTEQAIAIDRTDARPWDMKGRICRRLHPDPESTLAWQSSLKFHEKAAALAWRDLCRAAWQVKERDVQHRVLEAQRSALDPWRKALVINFRNLGVAHLKAGYVNSAISIFRQAISQQPDEDLYFQLGEGLFEKKAFRKASVAYRQALNTAKSPKDRARYRAHIAVAEAKRFYAVKDIRTREAALNAYQLALTSPTIMDLDTRNKLREACVLLNEVDSCAVWNASTKL